MNELTDLQICKKIAEIEGYHTNLAIKCEGVWCSMNDNNCYGVFNPLTDDALCFQLMVKYDCDLISPYRPNKDTHWECQIFTSDCADVVSIYNDSPNKAICLAIIEAHKDQS